MEKDKPRCLQRSSLALLQPGHPNTPPLARSLVQQDPVPLSPIQILWKTTGDSGLPQVPWNQAHSPRAFTEAVFLGVLSRK